MSCGLGCHESNNFLSIPGEFNLWAHPNSANSVCVCAIHVHFVYVFTLVWSCWASGKSRSLRELTGKPHDFAWVASERAHPGVKEDLQSINSNEEIGSDNLQPRQQGQDISLPSSFWRQCFLNRGLNLGNRVIVFPQQSHQRECTNLFPWQKLPENP